MEREGILLERRRKCDDTEGAGLNMGAGKWQVAAKRRL
jgi:hypothetical protein